jgi:hypothetical protein
MGVVRQIYESLPETVDTPDSLKNRPVEVILGPLDEAPVRPDKRRKKNCLMSSLEHGREKPSRDLIMANSKPKSLWDDF